MNAEDELVRVIFDEADVLRPGDPRTPTAAETAAQVGGPHLPLFGIEGGMLHDNLDDERESRGSLGGVALR